MRTSAFRPRFLILLLVSIITLSIGCGEGVNVLFNDELGEDGDGSTKNISYFDVVILSPVQKACLPIPIIITARNSSDEIVTEFSGSANLSDSTGSIDTEVTGNFTDGVWSGDVIITITGPGNIITCSKNSRSGMSAPFDVDPGDTLGSIEVTDNLGNEIGDQTAGEDFIMVITAYDACGNIKTDYSGTPTITSLKTTITPVDTSAYGFTNGVCTINDAQITQTATDNTITIDAGGGKTDTTALFNVGPGILLGSIEVRDNLGNQIGDQIAGEDFIMVITAFDLFGNIKTNYSGTPTITALLTAISPADTSAYGFTDGVCTINDAVITETATDNTITVDAGGGKTDTTTDFDVGPGILLGSIDITDDPGDPSDPVAGANIPLTITAIDDYGNVKTDYSGTPTITSLKTTITPTDTIAYGFTDGVCTINDARITQTATDNTLTVDAGGGKTDTTVLFDILPAALDYFTFDPITITPTTNVAFSIKITAYDVYNNIKTNYGGTATLNDTTGTLLPGSAGGFTSGVWNNTVTISLARAGIIITATDGTEDGTSNAFEVANPPCGNNGNFTTPAPTYSLGTEPRDVAIGDFDSDDIADIAITNYGSNSVSILLGNGGNGRGDSTFAAKADYPVGNDPHAITIGDFNSDGIQDLAVTNILDNNVSILLGNGHNGRGNGTFSASSTCNTGNGPYAIDTGDFDSDGITDLAVADYNGNTASILLGNGSNGKGDGTFTLNASYPADTSPTGITVGDFNSDGRQDLALANWNANTYSILLGDGANGVGDGTFGAASNTGVSGIGPRRIKTDDFNSDGNLDLAIILGVSNLVDIYLGDGAGAFSNDGSYPVGSTPFRLAISDFNNDNILDIAATNSGGNNVSVLLGNRNGTGQGDGTFEPKTDFPVGATPLGIAVGDFNADSFPDIVAVNKDGGTASILMGEGSECGYDCFGGNGTFANFDDYTVGNGPVDIASGDFNSDGITDLALIHDGDNDVKILIGDGINGQGGGTYSNDNDYAVGTDPKKIVTGDFDSDGITDLAVTNYGDGSVTILKGDQVGGKGLGTFTQISNFPVSKALAIAVGDFNADKIQDLAVVNDTTKEVCIFTGDGDCTFTPGNTYGIGDVSYDMVTGDFNSDNILDLALTKAPDLIAVFTGNESAPAGCGRGDGTFVAAGDYTTGAAGLPDADPRALVVGDFNTDGILDLAVANAADDNVSILTGDGSGGQGDGTFAAPLNYSVGVGATPVDIVTGDFNSDGIIDLATANQGDDTISILTGIGSGGIGVGTFEAAVNNVTGVDPVALVAGRFNADRILDLAIVINNTSELSIWHGNGNPCTPPAPALIVYVDWDSPAVTPDGTSWGLAFKTIQEGINAASAGGEVWVTQGTYDIFQGSETDTLRLGDEVAVYGGFTGVEVLRSERALNPALTIIDGLNQCYTLITGGSKATLDNFTITNGNASGSLRSEVRGGGLYNEFYITLENCTLSNNHASSHGGAIYNEPGVQANIINCTFTSNSADIDAGAIHNFDCPSVLIQDSTFSLNTAEDDAGAIMNTGGSIVTINNCDFNNNSTVDLVAPFGNANAGAVYLIDSGTTVTITGSNFNSNSSQYVGGAFYFNAGTSLTLTTCTFTNNSAVTSGGAFYQYMAESTITGCTFTSNTAVENGGAIYQNQATSTISGCTFTSNDADDFDGGAIYIVGAATVQIEGTDFITNMTDNDGGAICISGAANVTVDNSTFDGNITEDTLATGDASAGAIAIYAAANLTVTDSTFKNNSCIYNGGAVASYQNSILTIENSIFFDNTANGNGGGIHTNESTDSIINSVFYDNTCLSGNGGGFNSGEGNAYVAYSTFYANNSSINGGGIFFSSDNGHTCTIVNSILWANIANAANEDLDITGAGTPASVDLLYSNVDVIDEGDLALNYVEGNIVAVPQFVDAVGRDFDLQSTSPCIDYGDGSVGPFFDIEGVPRQDDGAIPDNNRPGPGLFGPPWVDMGAYEYNL